jgi:hypothetical protein
MLTEPMRIKGHLIVFPIKARPPCSGEFVHLPKLSPLEMGPVEHGQPGLPPASSIENFYQGSKVFPQEIEGDKLTETFYRQRLEWYTDLAPRRQKYKNTRRLKHIPRFFIWVDKKGVEHRLTQIESRQFYCTFYERFVTTTLDYARLIETIEVGTNVQICGYDGVPIEYSENETHADAIMRAYLDPGTPFGHERVLYAMLHIRPSQYPWRILKKFDF